MTTAMVGGRSPVIDDYMQTGQLFARHTHRQVTTLRWFDLVRDRLVREGVRNADRMGLVHFKDSGRISIVYWIYRPGEGKGPGLFTELEALPCHPGRDTDEFDYAFINHRFLRHALRPRGEQIRDIRRMRANEKSEQAAANALQAETRRHATEVLRKTLGEDAAATRLTEQGVMPVRPPSEERIEQVREMADQVERKAQVACTQPAPS